VTTAKTTSEGIRDRELMRYLDGDLDEGPRRELERRLESDADARDKLAGLRLAGALVREHALADHRADSIADAVMGKLDALDEETAESERQLVAEREAPRKIATAKPANDNARPIWAVAALAAAAAAALFVWSKNEPDRDLASAPTATSLPAEPSVPAPPPESHASAAETVQDEGDDDIEVATVDFGDNTGTVFYASAGRAPSAVVWVNDMGGKP
jgi:hypothetical protein